RAWVALVAGLVLMQGSPASAASLRAVLTQLAIPSGIHFHIPDALAQEPLRLQPVDRTEWPDVVAAWLQGYNWVGTRDFRGRLVDVRIISRKGDAMAPHDASSRPLAEAIQYRHGGIPPATPDAYPAEAVYQVRLDSAQLNALPVTGRIAFTLPDGRHTYIHDRRWIDEGGSTTWVGYDETDASRLNRAIITLDGNAVEGQIRTGNSLYWLASSAGRQWLIDVKATGMNRAEMDQADAPGAARSFAATDFTRPVSQAAPTTAQSSIDVLLLYTAGLEGNVGNKLKHRLALANQALVDSGSDVRFRNVGISKVGYPDNAPNGKALNDLTRQVGPLRNVPALRNRRGADIVLLVRPFRPERQGNYCGLTWINGSGGSPLDPERAYGLVSLGHVKDNYCSPYALAHELGHALGATHDRHHPAGSPGVFEYAHGYGISGQFGDIMSYFTPEVGIYANPDVLCKGVPCGIAAGEPDAADVVATFRQTGPIVAGFRVPRKP
ncbi:MAG: reprolysin-like metallopeptidase, partial [Methylococcaceae bacterium]